MFNGTIVFGRSSTSIIRLPTGIGAVQRFKVNKVVGLDLRWELNRTGLPSAYVNP